MILNNDTAITDAELESLLAADAALAAGDSLSSSSESGSTLEAVHECQRLLESVWPRSTPASPKAPSAFGRFAIVCELGRGGFGIVFLAQDTVLGRQVALKVPRPEVLVTPEVRRRFLREAEAASRLDHPHIVPVFEVGEEGPVCYIASAYCEGKTLSHWLREQAEPVPIRIAGALVAALAAAVAHAHERGILHRDLKPSNILLQDGAGSPWAKEGECRELGFLPRICDFGLAKLLDQVSQETCTGMPIGSPSYMAPEQAGGRVREHGRATDVYALGVILYELLTGQPPHRGQTDLETLRLVADQEPAAPRTLRGGLPRDLETVVLKCLAKRPTDRYASAAELHADLVRYLDGRPVQARPISLWERAAKWARRRPIHATMAVVLLAAVPGALGAFRWFEFRQQSLAISLQEQSDREARNFERKLTMTQIGLAAAQVDHGEFDRARATLPALDALQVQGASREFAWSYLDRLVRPRPIKIPDLPQRVMGLSQSQDGRLMALTDSTNGDTFLFDRETSTLRKLIARKQLRWCPRTVFSPDGRILATVAYGVSEKDRKKNKVNVWETNGGGELEGIADDFHLCYQILFSPDGGHLITVEALPGGPITVVRIWAISEQMKRITLVESLRGDALKARVSVDRRAADEDSRRPFRLSDLLAITPDERQTVAVSLETGETLLYARSGYNMAVCRVLDSEVIVVPRTNFDTAYGLTELEEIVRDARLLTRRARSKAIGVDLPILAARFSRDGRIVAAYDALKNRSPRGTIQVFDVATGERGRRLARLDSSELQCFDFALRGDALLLMSPGGSVWELPEWPLAGHRKEVWGLAFAPDGRTLASSSDDHTIKLWNLASGHEMKTLAAHGSLVTEIAYSPDGKTLASAGWDKTVRLWEGSSGALVKTFLGHPAHVRVVAFSPDGKTLASACDGGEIRLWNVAMRREQIGPLRAPVRGMGFASPRRRHGIRLACLRAGRGNAVFSRQQCDDLSVESAPRRPSRHLGRGRQRQFSCNFTRWPDAGRRARAWNDTAVGCAAGEAPRGVARPFRRCLGRHVQSRRFDPRFGRPRQHCSTLGSGVGGATGDAQGPCRAGARRGLFTRRGAPCDRQP
jgi:WD40 repeat protein